MFHPTSFVINGEEVHAIYCKLINLGERVSLSLGCAVSRGGIRETRWGGDGGAEGLRGAEGADIIFVQKFTQPQFLAPKIYAKKA